MTTQAEIAEWVRAAYGGGAADDPVERGMRLLEEAGEAAQALGVSEELSWRILTRVFARASGDVRQELAQTLLVLCAAASSVGVDVVDALAEEFERVRSRPNEYWRERYEKKIAEGVAR